MQNIQRKIIDDAICVLTFDRVNSPMNIFDRATLLELDGHLGAIRADPKIKGLVICSEKNSVFIAGADLNALARLRDEELRSLIELGQTVFNHLADLKIPTVAAIHGACVGGGYELCLACDYRVATRDRVTKIGLPEINLGILPAWGGSTRLPRLIGLPRALDVILGGKTPSAERALKMGMIDGIAPREYLLQAACRAVRHRKPHRIFSRIVYSPPVNRVFAAVIAKLIEAKILDRTRGLYPAVLKAREVVLRGAADWNRTASLTREADAVAELSKTDACRNLMSLFFLQERAKKLSHPEASKLPPQKISRTAVIGAGVMGASIAQWLSARGMRVVLRDVNAARVAGGMDRALKLYSEAFGRHQLSFLEARDGFDRISPVASEFPMKGVEIVIETAVEKMDLKKQIFAKLDAQAPPETILATNTSALSISEIASATKNPERVVGMHFFNPVHKMQLVEVVLGKQTRPDVAQRALRFAQQIGKLPVLVRDSPGFLVNRILLPYLVEAACLFESGATVESIDEAMLEFGMPMGPLRLIDEVGVDIAADVAATLAGKFSGRLRMPELLAKMGSEKLLGRKTGAGFYVYKNKGQTVNRRVEKLRGGNSPAVLRIAELQRRMTLLMVNEAARCLEEQVVASAADVDFGMVMGTGFAPFRGGPLAYADAVVIAKLVDNMKSLVQAAGPRYEPCALLCDMAATGKKFHEN